VATSSSSLTSSSSSSLGKGEAIFKITSVSGNDYQLEVTDSSFPDSKYFKKGAKLTKLTITGVTLTAGKSYKVQIDFTENADGSFDINTLKIVSEV
jgi:hypothetical protein